MALNDRQPSPPPPPFGNGKIPLIKIKLPKKAAKGGEDGKKHMCVACNRNFISGKALGGHMSSAHVQANKDYSYKKLSSSKRKDPSPDSDSGDTSPCPVCGREFSSQKSLFGHMRCHPDRFWRGMVPPSNLKITDDSTNSSSSSSDGAAAADRIDPGVKELGFHLKKWPTSKRGRAPVSVAPPPRKIDDEDEDGDDLFAARHLIKILSKEDEQVNLKKAEVIIGESDGKGGKSILDVEIPETLIGEGVTDELYMTAIHVLMNGKRERERERERGMAMEEEENTSEKYKCNECSRYFPTHQALGGHRSSHNKFKMSVVNTATRDAAAAGQPDTPPPALRRKRKEKEKEKEKVAKTTGNAAAAEAALSTGPFAFDLNMAPEDEEGQSSSDHA